MRYLNTFAVISQQKKKDETNWKMNAVQLSVNGTVNEWAAERKHWFNLY